MIVTFSVLSRRANAFISPYLYFNALFSFVVVSSAVLALFSSYLKLLSLFRVDKFETDWSRSRESTVECGVSRGTILGNSVRFGVEALYGGDGVRRMDATLGIL